MMRFTLFLCLLSVGISYAQNITNYDKGIETFVDEDYYIRIFSKENLVSYELWDITRDKRKLSQVIKAPKGSKVTNYVIINPVRLKEGEYMIKLIRQNDVKKVWFNLAKFKERQRKYSN